MGNVQSIPEGKMDHVSADEREEFETFRTGADNDYAPGIMNIPNPYETTRPVKVISRERNTAVDKSEQSVVRSGRKAKNSDGE
jgi:hypothetical protein